MDETIGGPLQLIRGCSNSSNVATACPVPLLLSTEAVVARWCSIISSKIPDWLRRIRSFRFSSETRRAATCISADASIPWSSHCRTLFSSSWRYSFLLARLRLWLSRMRARLAFSWAERAWRAVSVVFEKRVSFLSCEGTYWCRGHDAVSLLQFHNSGFVNSLLDQEA